MPAQNLIFVRFGVWSIELYYERIKDPMRDMT